jgi:hypothetical protein
MRSSSQAAKLIEAQERSPIPKSKLKGFAICHRPANAIAWQWYPELLPEGVAFGLIAALSKTGQVRIQSVEIDVGPSPWEPGGEPVR